MIDWHSHILPKVDDGSRDIEESKRLLELLAEQGVTTVVATPHFIADNESVPNFIERRNAAYNKLKDYEITSKVKILLGAEVMYYSGISRLEELRSLCIENTRLLLLEMPIATWTEYTVKELIETATTKNIVLILAHVERALKLQSKNTMHRLMGAGVLMQVNASFFTDARTRRKALKLLKKGNIQLVGSDCHNTSERPPEIGKAYEIINRKFGEDFVSSLNEYGKSVLV